MSCASKELSTAWADRLIGITRLVLGPERRRGDYFHGTVACPSALFRAERYQEIVRLVSGDLMWPYKRWAVKALATMGRKSRYCQ